MKIDSYTKTIAATATPVNMVADTGKSWSDAREVIVTCPSGNTSDLTIGSKARQTFVVAKGTSLRLSEINRAGGSGRFELSDMWIKAGTNGDTVSILLVDPSNPSL